MSGKGLTSVVCMW